VSAVEETSRISASAVGAAHGADPVEWCRHPTFGAAWVNEQNDVIFKVEIGNEA
jgi:hypothetical protein